MASILDSESNGSMAIAIVGYGCRLPGGASSGEKFWDMLMEKRSARKDTPADRFNIDAFYHPHGERNGTLNVRKGHFLDEDISAFDARFFSISPAEALSMDPMQRMLLEVVYEATENAGIPISSLAGSNTGCYVGCFSNDYDQISKKDPELLPKYHSVGTGQSILSNRISFCFNLQGPSVTVDTACSSSLVAVHMACQSLRLGESDTVIVGATQATLNPDMMIGMTNLHFLSPDGVCHAFDSRANGYARGEGMAALVMKPLKSALRDGDTIRAVIRGTAVNQNGNNAGITLPSESAQARLIRSAYESAGCDPSVTAYAEAHGTGTQAGDPREARAIGETLGKRDGGEKLYVGSVKTNIGHLEGASGLAGMIKTILSLEHGVIAPNIWFDKGNPAIDFDALGIRVATEATPWPVSGLRRASVNSFGYGGTNGHVILDDAYHFLLEHGLQGKHRTVVPSIAGIQEGHGFSVQTSGTNSETASIMSSDHSDGGHSFTGTVESQDTDVSDLDNAEPRPKVFVLTGHEKTSVVANAKAMGEHVERQSFEDDETYLNDLAFTLAERRSKLEVGAAVVATSKAELVSQLMSLDDTAERSNHPPHLSFVFTGQGAQWWAMGRELMQYPVFADSLAACASAVESFGASWSLLDEFMKSETSSRINDAEISQPMCSALQIALVDLYASWNVHPASVVGHSSGEIAAAYATGALDLYAAMQIAYFRGLLSPEITRLGYKGGMLAAGIGEQEANTHILSMDPEIGKVAVACINSPSSVTISGDVPALNEMQKILTAKNLFARRLQVETAYHSHHMQAIAEHYLKSLENLKVQPWASRKNVSMFSSVKERLVTAGDQLDGAYWVENMVSAVRFSGALAELARDASTKASDGILVELGPHSALAGPVKQVLASLSEEHQSFTYLSTLIREKKPRGATVTTLIAAAALYVKGIGVNLRPANFPLKQQGQHLTLLTDLPTYNWNRTRKYWAESRISKGYRFRPFARTDLLGAPVHDWNPTEPRWRNFLRLSEQPWIKGHKIQGAIAYPAAGYCCMAIEAAAQLSMIALQVDADSGKPARFVKEFKMRNVEFKRALLVPDSEEGIEVSVSLRPDVPTQMTGTSAWWEFRIYSYTSEGQWAEHCEGSVAAVYEDEENTRQSLANHQRYIDVLEQAQETCLTAVPRNELYTSLDRVGLSYGSEFQGITDVHAGKDHAWGHVKVFDTAAGMPAGFEFPRLIHPSTLDALLQMGIAAAISGDIRNLTKPYVPTWLTEMTLAADISARPDESFRVAARTNAFGLRELRSDVSAGNIESESPAIVMEGIKLLAIAVAEDEIPVTDVTKLIAAAVWEPDVDLIQQQDIHNVLDASVEPGYDFGKLRDLEFLGYHYVTEALKQVSEEEIAGMLPHHQKFYRYMQHQRAMVNAGSHEQWTPEWSQLDKPDVKTRIQSLQLALEASDPGGQMFTRMGPALSSVLRQEVEPLGLMMKDKLLFDYYHYAPGSQGTYPKVQQYLTLLSHKYPDLEYLEIGAGTGGCTKPALEALSGTAERSYPRCKSYTYTDISSGFFEQAAAKFDASASILNFKKLDIEQDPWAQVGFEEKHQYDVIVAANVLHATYDMDRTLTHVRKLLRPGGKLVLLEVTHSTIALSLIFGNLPGWWNCREDWREFGPLLTEKQWEDVLKRNGFAGLEVCSPDVKDPLLHQADVMVATAVEPTTADEVPGPEKVDIIEPSGAHREAHGLVKAVEQKVLAASPKTIVETVAFEEMASRDLSNTAVISLLELENAVVADISTQDLQTLQNIIRTSTGLIWVTRGGIASKGTIPEMAVFQGMARTLRGESEHVPCVTVDLDRKTRLPDEKAGQLIQAVFEQNFKKDSSKLITLGIPDREISEDRGMLHIKRAIEIPKLDELIAAKAYGAALAPKLEDISSTSSSRPLKLQVSKVGDLDSIVFDDDAGVGEDTPLPNGSVEISVQAVGVSVRDALVCTGEIATDFMGSECAGIITRIGVTTVDDNLCVGDRVVALALGAYATTIRTPRSMVKKIPDKMEFPMAASLPFAITAAYYALIHVARLDEGDSLLIHDGALPTGQAALQIAQYCGASAIFVTVSSEDQRRHVVDEFGLLDTQVYLHSDMTFAASILAATKGEGVDVVLNTLQGDVLQATWDVISSCGRFVELETGTRADQPRQPVFTPLTKNVSFTVVDVLDVVQKQLKLAGKIFNEAWKLVEEGHFQHQSSKLRHEPMSKIGECMKALRSGTEQRPVVVGIQAQDLVPTIPKRLRPISLTPDGSYILVGGFGGLGRQIARWMVTRGARNLIFVSRRGISSPHAAALVAELEAGNVRVKVLECDASDKHRLKAGIADALQTMPPLRGAIHGAMNIADQVFTNMSHETFAAGIRPKVQASWALHEATLDQPLDFLILLASAAGFFGSVGQANYVAGCTYQVALAAHRRSLGLPAVAIDVGKMLDIGYVAEDDTGASGRNLNHLGMQDVRPDELLAQIEMAMQPLSQQNDIHIPRGHLLTGINSTNDPGQGVELPFWGRDPVFAHMDFVRPHMRKSAKLASQTDEDAARTKPLPDLLADATSLAEATAHVLDALRQKLARALLLSLEELDPRKGMAAFGLDSLVAVELRGWLGRDAGVDLPVFEILQANSLNALAKQVAGKSKLVRKFD